MGANKKRSQQSPPGASVRNHEVARDPRHINRLKEGSTWGSRILKKYSTLLIVLGPIVGFVAGIYKSDIKKWLDQLFGPVMVVSASQIVLQPSSSSTESNSYQYEGTAQIKNDGLSGGHDVHFAVIAPLHCFLGPPQVETQPRNAAPLMNPESKPFQPKIDVNRSPETYVWHVEVWPRNAEIIIKYLLTCSEPLEPSKPSKLGVGSFNEDLPSRDISVNFPCSDVPTGKIVDCSVPTTSTQEDSEHRTNGKIVHLAENSRVASSRYNNDYDTPLILAMNTPANTGGWNNANLTVSFSGAEGVRDSGQVIIEQVADSHDHFGHSGAWVPLLSLQVNMTAFTNEVDASVPIIFLSQWLQAVANKNTADTTALQDTMNQLGSEANAVVGDVNAAEESIPSLQNQAAQVNAQLQNIQAALQERETELLREAEHGVEEQRDVLTWKKALRVIGTVAETVPAFQPAQGQLDLDLEPLIQGLPNEDNRHLADLAVTNMVVQTNRPTGPAARVRLIINRRGDSTETLGGHAYKFHFGNGPNDQPFTWGASFNLPNGPLSQKSLSVSGLSLLESFLNISVPADPRLVPLMLFERPGADAMVTLVLAKDPADLNAQITNLQMSATVDFFRTTSSQVKLFAKAPSNILPYIKIDHPDLTGRSDGLGAFSRTYSVGDTVTLQAEPIYGPLQFMKWVDDSGNVVGNSLTLSVTLAKTTSVKPVYAVAISGRVQDGSGNGMANVAINLTGTQSGTALTDTDGNYQFSKLLPNALTSSAYSCSINPNSQSFHAAGGNDVIAITTQRGCSWTSGSPDLAVVNMSGNVGSDNEPATGIERINYSATGAQSFTSAAAARPSASFRISREGIATFTFFGTDIAGNIEAAKTITIKLDKTPPTIIGSRVPAPNVNRGLSRKRQIQSQYAKTQYPAPVLQTLILESGGAHLTSSTFVVAKEQSNPLPIQEADLGTVSLPLRLEMLNSGGTHLTAATTIRSVKASRYPQLFKRQISFSRRLSR